MRDLVTVEWIRERDTANLLTNTDSSTLESEITAMSNLICQKVGHDFGNLENTEQELDGSETSALSLVGRTIYPLRNLTAAYIDDHRVPATNIISRGAPLIGGLKMFLRLKIGTWNGYTVKLTGDFGWEAIPNDVMEAVFRLVRNKIVGNPEDEKVKSLRHPDGVQVTYAIQDLRRSGTGDEYADSVIRKYRWIEGGGMI